MQDLRTKKLRKTIKDIYAKGQELVPFHGWHHVCFVTKESLRFADSIGANLVITEIAALVHDLNYLVPEKGAGDLIKYRTKLLKGHGFKKEEIEFVDTIIEEMKIFPRGPKVLKETMAVADGDVAFQSHPLTPVLLAQQYLEESGKDIDTAASSIVKIQNDQMERGLYFYTELAKKDYLGWAETNLKLWKNIQESLKNKKLPRPTDTD